MLDEINTQTIVGVDKDKGSQEAVKWAVDNLLFINHTVILLHIRRQSGNTHYGFVMAETTDDAVREQFEAEMSQLFQPYRGFCVRKGEHTQAQLKEVVVEDTDVSKAIVEYATLHSVHNIVLSASNRNVFTRKFRNPDVPSCVMKSAPDFCTVYVISKGKQWQIRSAKGPPPPVSAAVQRQSLPPSHHNQHHNHHHHHHNSDDSAKAVAVTKGSWRGSNTPPPAPQNPERRSLEKSALKRAALKGSPGHVLHDSLDIYNHSQRASTSRDSLSEDFDAQRGVPFFAANFADSFDLSMCSNPDTPNRFVEAEVNRLKLELTHTMDMYSTACKEAITSKQKAKELEERTMEESRMLGEARQAEEAALALVEMEKAKCRAAIETAQAAQRLAEMESQRRVQAEMKARRESEEKVRALTALAHKDHRYRKYTIEEIELATEYFSEALKIGEGGYGPVYSASLDHTPVAIKVLRPDAAQGRKQFLQEVEVLSCIRHPNMVLLLGACPEYGCLVYEYMDNGSLEDRLFQRGKTPPIPWPVRFKIAAEIATGLLFLHQAKPEPLVHRDLKPGNILLDQNYRSKISDVGLSRLVPPSVADSVTQYRMTSTAGTFCYIDPEYQQTGMLGTKSDVYSLGVLLLQLVTSKGPMGLTHLVEKALDRGTLPELLDPTVPDWPDQEVAAFARLALKCTELRKKDRPDLAAVILPELNRLRNLSLAYSRAASKP